MKDAESNVQYTNLPFKFNQNEDIDYSKNKDMIEDKYFNVVKNAYNLMEKNDNDICALTNEKKKMPPLVTNASSKKQKLGPLEKIIR